ncbi:MAG: hypothetical protein WBX25_28445 [Rhodomicrobium sp.]
MVYVFKQGELFPELPPINIGSRRRKKPNRESSIKVEYKIPEPARRSWLRRWWKRIAAGGLALLIGIGGIAWDEVRREGLFWIWGYLKGHVSHMMKSQPNEPQSWVTKTIRSPAKAN